MLNPFRNLFIIPLTVGFILLGMGELGVGIGFCFASLFVYLDEKFKVG